MAANLKLQPSEELAAMFPQPIVTTIRGKEISVLPLTISQLGHVARALKPVIEESGVSLDMAGLIANHTESVTVAVAKASGQSETWVGSLYADEFLILATAVWDANADFFVQRVAPLAAKLLEKRATLGVGSTPASDLKSMATPT